MRTTIAILLVLSFALFVFCIQGLLRYAEKSGRMLPRRVAFFLIGFVLAFLVWLAVTTVFVK